MSTALEYMLTALDETLNDSSDICPQCDQRIDKFGVCGCNCNNDYFLGYDDDDDDDDGYPLDI